MTKDELIELFNDTVKPLYLIDKESGSNLVNALDMYINNKFNVTKTADAMHVHRNTMIYQLDKIKEILDIDFLDYEYILKLQMGIHAMKLLKANDK